MPGTSGDPYGYLVSFSRYLLGRVGLPGFTTLVKNSRVSTYTWLRRSKVVPKGTKRLPKWRRFWVPGYSLIHFFTPMSWKWIREGAGDSFGYLVGF